MESKNLIGMLAGYYLSRFDDVAYGRFPAKSQREVHDVLAQKIGVPTSSLKLWRDEFDPIHSNSRQGWHKRKMSPSRLRMAELLADLSEPAIFRLLNDCMETKDGRLLRLLEDVDEDAQELDLPSSTRGITGARAEEHFIAWYQRGDSIFHGTLKDCRLLQCGYDFQAQHADITAHIEVKGLKGQQGGILLTDKEWTTACELGQRYFIVLVRSVELAAPQIEVFQNPAASLSCRQNVTTVLKVSWTVPKLDPADAVWKNQGE